MGGNAIKKVKISRINLSNYNKIKKILSIFAHSINLYMIKFLAVIVQLIYAMELIIYQNILI